jgi:hypothetical protein
MTDGASLAEHIAGGFVGRADVVVEVGVVADRLLEEPGDVVNVGGSDTAVRLRLCPRCVLNGGVKA